MDKNLEELFALPIKPTLEAVVDGQKFYSSPRLKAAFLKSIGGTGRSSKLYDQISQMVMKKKNLVPCFLSKNMFRFFKHKMFGHPEDKSALAFYHMGIKKVFILIDNNITSVGTAENDELASTTIHECVHLYADKQRKKFLNTFKDELNRYYISFFSRVFDLKAKPNLNNFFKFLTVYEYQRSFEMNRQLTKYYNILQSTLMPLSKLEENKFKKNLTDLIVLIKIYLTDFNSFVRIYRKYMHILGPLDRAYLDAFGKANKKTSPFQELSSISEVISVFSEIRPNHSKIKKMFKDLA